MSLKEEYHYVQVNYDCTFIVLTRYKNLIRVGNGSSGIVCVADDEVLKQKVAIKKLVHPFRSEFDAKRAYREFMINKLSNHVNIVKLLNIFTHQKDQSSFDHFYIVMEYMEYDLGKALGRGIDLDHERLSFLVYQLLCGIRNLHLAGIIHRDLKPSNIGVNLDCSLKIFDFGLARSEDLSMTPYVVTRYYRAPEIITQMNYDAKVDIWSIGCIFAEMITKRILFPGEDGIVGQWNKIIQILGTPDISFFQKLNSSVSKVLLSLPKWTPKSFELMFPDSVFPVSNTEHPNELNAHQARDLLQNFLVIDPSQRIDVNAALHHPYVNLWWDASEIYAAPPEKYDPTIEDTKIQLPQLKEIIFKEIKAFQP